MDRTEGDGLLFSLQEFDLLWQEIGTDHPPYPLDVPSHGATYAERKMLSQALETERKRVGLTADAPSSDSLQELIAALAKPDVSLDLTVFGTEQLRAVAAAGRRIGVVAAQDEQEVALEPIGKAELVAALLQVVGEAGAAPGKPVSLPRRAYSRAMRAYAEHGRERCEGVLDQAGLSWGAARLVMTMVQSERYVGGQFGANGPAGRSSVLNWVDTAEGRYAMITDADAGEPWVTISPAGPKWLSDRLQEMLGEVR